MDTKWFKEKLSETKQSQASLARYMGLDPAMVSLMLRGKRSMKTTEAAKIARFLGTSIEDIIVHTGEDLYAADGARAITSIGSVGDDGEVFLSTETDIRVAAPADMPEGCVALRAKTLGTSWALIDGWMFFSLIKDNDVAADVNGRLCVVGLESGRRVLRFVHRGYSPGCFNLIGMFGGSSEDVRVRSAAPVLWIRP